MLQNKQKDVQHHNYFANHVNPNKLKIKTLKTLQIFISMQPKWHRHSWLWDFETTEDAERHRWKQRDSKKKQK